jgi:hypothetical protein
MSTTMMMTAAKGPRVRRRYSTPRWNRDVDRHQDRNGLAANVTDTFFAIHP